MGLARLVIEGPASSVIRLKVASKIRMVLVVAHPGPSAAEIHLSERERARLIGMSAESSRVAVRARIVLACAGPGISTAQVALDLGLAKSAVRKWRAAFARG
ncbi:helix-turn-helix domain-containing protein [Nonomuraea ceibae]|uniref:helix-turn-helix domain-containing protein n=1 Tax=Nonomuraea ceibae TaxID=1935170 RepID=UPI003556A3BD